MGARARGFWALVIAVSAMAVEAASATPPDADVMQVVLRHFSKRVDAVPHSHGRVVLIDRYTEMWSQERLGFFRLGPTQDTQCPVDAALLDSLAERNPSPSPVSTFVTASRWWEVLGPKAGVGMNWQNLKSSSGAPVKTIAYLSKPGFSADENRALVVFFSDGRMTTKRWRST